MINTLLTDRSVSVRTKERQVTPQIVIVEPDEEAIKREAKRIKDLKFRLNAVQAVVDWCYDNTWGIVQRSAVNNWMYDTDEVWKKGEFELVEDFRIGLTIHRIM